MRQAAIDPGPSHSQAESNQAEGQQDQAKNEQSQDFNRKLGNGRAIEQGLPQSF